MKFAYNTFGIIQFHQLKKFDEDPTLYILTKEEINKILKAIDRTRYDNHPAWNKFLRERNKLMVIVGYTLALRPKEICNIKISDINFAVKKIFIPAYANKKARYMPVPDWLIKKIKKYLKFPEKFWIGKKKKRQKEYLFPSKYSKRISTSRFKDIFREACKKAGIYRIKGISKKGQILSLTRPYSLRHTKATEILMKTRNIYYTALYLGHSNISSTLKYIHILKDFLANFNEPI